VNRPEGDSSTDTASCATTMPVSGYHALKAASLALNSTASHGMPGRSRPSTDRAARSPPDATTSRTPVGRGPAGPASRPSARTPRAGANRGMRATTAPVHPGQCVMLPTTPGGHTGAPRASASTGIRSNRGDSDARARRAQCRPVANSACRAADDPATCPRSSGSRPSGPASVSVAANPSRQGGLLRTARSRPMGLGCQS
jgi:hypothetical protein